MQSPLPSSEVVNEPPAGVRGWQLQTSPFFFESFSSNDAFPFSDRIAWTMLNWLQAFQNRAGCWAAHQTYLSFSFPLPASLLISSSLVAVQVLSRVRLFVTPWTAALQASLSITVILSWFKFMSIESVMPSNHGIVHGCHPLLLLPSVFPSIKVFSNELALCIRWPKY